MADNEDRSLILRPDLSLGKAAARPTRVLTEIVEQALALAKDFAPGPIDLDALVQQGKTLYLHNVDGIIEDDIHAFEHWGNSILSKIERHKSKGMTKENIRAFQLFLQAAEAGHSEAQFLVAELCYWGGVGVSKDEIEAVKWFRKAADEGNLDAERALGFCYSWGKGVQKDDVAAAKWYRKSAEKGDAGAQQALGMHYVRGEGVVKDYVKAVKWIRMAAEQGNSNAQFSLGYRYQHGQGVKIDLTQAYAWFQLAADQGDENARNEARALAAFMKIQG